MKILISLLSVFWCQFIARADLTPISQIQGSGAVSPLLSQKVETEGVVTGDFRGPSRLAGFYIQSLENDDDPATSEGLFVYQTSRSKWATVALKVGDKVRLAGKVAEFHGQTQVSNLTNLEVVETTTLPAPVEVRFPFPVAERERLEGMLVTFPDVLTVVEQGTLLRYGALTLASQGRVFNASNQQKKSEIAAEDRVIVLDDGSSEQGVSPMPYLDENGTRRAGDTISDLTGILGFDFEKYRLQPLGTPKFQNSNPRPGNPPSVGGNLKVAGVNLHNYWTTFRNSKNPDARGAQGATAFARQSAKIISALKAMDADVFGFMELENNPATLPELLEKLNAAVGANIYSAVADPTSGVGKDAIKVGLIYKNARLEPVGASISATAEIFDRRPVAQTFRDKISGGVFSVLVNHWKSKGSCPESGDVDLGEGCWNQKRTQQALAATKFVETLKKRAGDDDVLLLGDLNAYAFEKPMVTLRNAGWKHLNLRLPDEERYSFSFDGRFGSLDHGLATPSLDSQIVGVAEWHVNADEPYFLDFAIAGPKTDASPFRFSDHDPFLIGLNLKTDAKKAAPVKVAPKKPVKKVVPKKIVPKKAVVRKKAMQKPKKR